LNPTTEEFPKKGFSFVARKSNRYKLIINLKNAETMPTQIITTDDLREFKIELLEDIKSLLQKNTAVPQKKYLKSAEMMKLLKVSQGTLQTLRINGTLPYTKIGGIIFYDADEISKVMKENSIHNKF
jgi:hypothetical protein